MGQHKQIYILVSFLLVLGFGAVLYKHFVLGFPLSAGQNLEVWRVEAKIEFNGRAEQSAKVTFNNPDWHPARKITFGKELSEHFSFEQTKSDGISMANWQSSGKDGKQTIYYVAETYMQEGEHHLLKDSKPQALPEIQLSNVEQGIAQELLAKVSAPKTDVSGQTTAVLALINQLDNEQARVLLKDSNKRSDKVNLAVQLLSLQGIHSRLSRGIFLRKSQRAQSTVFFIEAYDKTGWRIYDPRDETALNWQETLIFSRNAEPMLEVFGGTNSSLSFATLRENRSGFAMAVDAGNIQNDALVNFSIYSLPIEQQATFKMLLLMPLGALVVVILRNLVGIRTSGTFMPILIAMTFLQTTLLTGLVLFLCIVSVGLVMRTYLTHLNLLLVPRIAAVLVFVIVIYGAFGVIGHKLNLAWAANVTLFPMIILSWTIERMSILWDEEGPHEVMIQGSGSLVVAIFAYFLMGSRFVADTVFLFPELLLVVLAVIILIGSYTGYRLSDLRRFEPMERF